MMNLKNKTTGNWQIETTENGGYTYLGVEVTYDHQFEPISTNCCKYDPLIHGPIICEQLGIECQGLEVLITIVIEDSAAGEPDAHTYAEPDLCKLKSITDSGNSNGVIIVIDSAGAIKGGRKTNGQISLPKELPTDTN